MNHQRIWFVLELVVGLSLLLSLLGSCGRDHGQSNPADVAETYIIEPYTGPCPAGQSSWDCMAWNRDKWE